MILLFGGEGGTGLTTGVLTEDVRLDDIGQGRTELLGAIRVHDILQVELLEEGDLTTGTLTESVRVSDGPLAVDPGSIDTGLLTEHVRLDDIGQGQTQLLGAIRVRDVLTAERVDIAGLFTGLLLEHVRVTDANDSWAQLETPEGVRVSDALTIERIGIGDIETLRTEGVRVRDTLTAERIGEGDRETSRTETLRVRDTVAALRVYQGPLFVTLTEHVYVSDTAHFYSPKPQVAMFLEYGFHPSSFRDTLIDEANCVSVWPLADVTGLAGERVHDIVGTHHGIFSGSGIVTGLSHGLPEGGLAMTFNGSWHIMVPDDSADGLPLNLSLANGDVDIVFIIHTLTNEATNRAIISKTDGTNGWRVSLVNGAIRWTEVIGGASHFSMDRGFVADGNWHVVQCCKQTLVGSGEARIFIDGVQSGATVTGANQELDATTADLFIGKFFDGTGGLIGSLSYIMLGREGDAGLGAALELCRYWTDISDDTRSVVPMVISYGIQGTRPMDNVAHTGTLTVALDNSTRNSSQLLGLYSLDHVNKRPYFRKGAPMRVRFTFESRSFVKHVGRMVSALPAPGRNLERLTRVTSVDWMDVAASSRLRIPTRTDIDSDLAIGLVIGDALRPPHAVAISPGAETFAYAMHMGLGGRETVMSEATRICTNEFGRFYVKGDQLLGGVVTYEGRADQQVKTAAAATFTNSMAGLTPNDGQKPNLLLVTVHPVEVDQTPPDVVFSMTARQPIPPYTKVQILVDYRDPDNTALRIAATDIITPVITTDYTMTVNEDGSGLDLSLSVIIEETGASLGGTNAVLTVTNDSASTGWFIMQLRGTIIRHEEPITVPVPGWDSPQIRADGPVEETLDLAYIGSRAFAQDLGEHILALYEAGKVASISFVANTSTELMRQALEREVGDRIDIVEEMQSGSVAHSYVINHVELQVAAALMIRCTWRLGPAADLGQVWLLGVAGSSEMGVTTVLGL